MNYYLRANRCLQKWYQYLRAIHQDQDQDQKHGVYLCIFVSLSLCLAARIYFQAIELQFENVWSFNSQHNHKIVIPFFWLSEERRGDFCNPSLYRDPAVATLLASCILLPAACCLHPAGFCNKIISCNPVRVLSIIAKRFQECVCAT